MMLNKTLAVALACALVTSPNLAQAEQAKNLVGMGIGAMTCTQFANFYKTNAEEAETAFFHWAQGFMSGFNAAQVANKQATVNLAAMEQKEQKAFLRRYCDQHPLGDYVEGVLQLWLDMQFQQERTDKRSKK
jgi:hypothetical protein